MYHITIKNKIIKSIPLLAYLNGVKSLRKTIKIYCDINFKFSNYKNGEKDIYIDKNTINIFRKSFCKLIWTQNESSQIAFDFLDSKIREKSIKLEKDKISRNSPILICVVKDDLMRVKMSIEHYRRIGIKNFVYLDNMSKDGTKEFLENQNDVDLYECSDKYTTLRREAWINKIIAHYGFDRWYLCVDSDEIFVYENMEQISIEKYISHINREKNRRIRALLIDMYSKKPLFSNEKGVENIRERFCYFDKDSYYIKNTYKYDGIVGGPRQRISPEKSFMLTKYPLFYFKKGDLQCCSHFQFPYKYNCDIPCSTGLLHYKFLENDLEKYIERAELGNYANGSEEYKKYVEHYKSNKIFL